MHIASSAIGPCTLGLLSCSQVGLVNTARSTGGEMLATAGMVRPRSASAFVDHAPLGRR